MRYRDASELKKSHLYQGVPLFFPEKSINIILALVGDEEELVLVTNGNVDLKPGALALTSKRLIFSCKNTMMKVNILRDIPIHTITSVSFSSQTGSELIVSTKDEVLEVKGLKNSACQIIVQKLQQQQDQQPAPATAKAYDHTPGATRAMTADEIKSSGIYLGLPLLFPKRAIQFMLERLLPDEKILLVCPGNVKSDGAVGVTNRRFFAASNHLLGGSMLKSFDFGEILSVSYQPSTLTVVAKSEHVLVKGVLRDAGDALVNQILALKSQYNTSNTASTLPPPLPPGV